MISGFREGANRWVSAIDIVCPGCGGLAVFDEPFDFLARDEQVAEGQIWHRWGNWQVVEKYPSVIHWSPPKTYHTYLREGGGSGPGYPLFHRGMVLCSSCHISKKIHTLSWPRDAWWQWEIRGQLLWAWDRPHAEEILEFILQKRRPHRPISTRLGRVPSFFLKAKLRHTVAQKISKSLRETPSIVIQG
jgi:hypothetical protein